jgi:hypothetical protein
MLLMRSGIDRFVPWSKLLACAMILALVWLQTLPWLSRQSAIHRSIERNERLGIDPSAKFYTEMPGMPDFYDRIEGARRRHSEDFWLPVASEAR